MVKVSKLQKMERVKEILKLVEETHVEFLGTCANLRKQQWQEMLQEGVKYMEDLIEHQKKDHKRWKKNKDAIKPADIMRCLKESEMERTNRKEGAI